MSRWYWHERDNARSQSYGYDAWSVRPEIRLGSGHRLSDAENEIEKTNGFSRWRQPAAAKAEFIATCYGLPEGMS